LPRHGSGTFGGTVRRKPNWKAGEDEPWYLATNIPDRQMTLQSYAHRMWIEEMFGDLKGHGFDLEGTMLRHDERLS